MKNIIILLGLPASGKGTQAALLSEQLKYENLSTGYLLRKEVESKTELGNKIAKSIDVGNLVSDDLIFEILKKNIEKSESNGFILDGFPRTLRQAEMLSNYLDNNENFELKTRIAFFHKFPFNAIYNLHLLFEKIINAANGRQASIGITYLR